MSVNNIFMTIRFKTTFFKNSIIFVILFLIALSPFVMNMRDSFVSDDWNFLYTASHDSIFSHDVWLYNNVGNHDGGTYRPMVRIFWRVMYVLFRDMPTAYHIATLFFHIANGFLLFFLSKKFLSYVHTKKYSNFIAYITALLFFVLPHHSEAVVWVSVVNDTMMTSFILSALFLFIHYMQTKKIIYYIVSLGMSVLAYMTKEMAIVLPIIFCCSGLWILWQNKNMTWLSVKKLFVLLTPFVLSLCIYMFARYYATGLLLKNYGKNIAFSLDHVLMSFFNISVSHVLSGVYRVYIAQGLYNHRSIVIILCIGLIALCIYTMYKKKIGSELVLFLLLYMIAIIPVSQFVLPRSMIYSSQEGERFAYFPSIFFVLMLVSLCSYIFQYAKNKKIHIVYSFVCVIVCGLLYVQLWQKNMQWHIASYRSISLLHSVEAYVDEYHPDAVVVFGLPDQYHGALMWRNGFADALRVRGKNLDMIVASARILYSEDMNVTVKRDGDVFDYYSFDAWHLGQKSISYYDYSLEFIDDEFFDSGRIAHMMRIQFSDEFLQTNRDKKIALLFFDGTAIKTFLL